MTVHTHGNGGYTHGCRCDVCIKAHSDYSREYRQRPEVKKRSATPEVKERRRKYQDAYCQAHGKVPCFRSAEELDALEARDHLGCEEDL